MLFLSFEQPKGLCRRPVRTVLRASVNALQTRLHGQSHAASGWQIKKTDRAALLSLAGESMSPSRPALVAQLDRVLDYESRGRGFESSPERHIFQRLIA